jgi:S-adenosyl methyltransferase
MAQFDTGVPHSARVYDYLLGGKDNYAADRQAGEHLLQAYPNLAFTVRANRAFLARAVRFLVTDMGIRQFLDIGTGIPAASNTHEVAQAAAPDSRIVYVDNDPIVLAHAQALMGSTPEGACDYLDADMHDPGTILSAAARTLDFTRPVAVMLVGIMQFAGDEAEAREIVGRLMAACAPGSFLTISHPASDIDAEQFGEATRRFNEAAPEAEQMTLRDRAAVARLFSGLDLVPPGLVRVAEWRPDSELQAASPGALWAGIARKP